MEHKRNLANNFCCKNPIENSFFASINLYLLMCIKNTNEEASSVKSHFYKFIGLED